MASSHSFPRAVAAPPAPPAAAAFGNAAAAAATWKLIIYVVGQTSVG